MPRYPVIKAKNLVRALLRAGFYIHHQTGSHVRLLHSSRKDLRITIPMHNFDIPIETLQRILKQADLGVEDLLKLL